MIFVETSFWMGCSYVDATSFVLMRASRMTHALAFDGDFAAAGFVELRPTG